MRRVSIRARMFVVVLALAVAAGCGAPRDVSTTSKALLGHWRNTVPATNNDIYFGPEEVTYAREGGKRAVPVRYSVESEDTQDLSLEIRIGPAEPTRVVFSEDYETMTMLPARIPEQLRYEYVDAEQEP